MNLYIPFSFFFSSFFLFFFFFFAFFTQCNLCPGQQIMEEMLDVQIPGCIPEYENMLIPKCHPLYDPDCRAQRTMPFQRSRYDTRTGSSPNTPREQLNVNTPWFDGALIYGPGKAWTNIIRAFTRGELAADQQDLQLANMFPVLNSKVLLPLSNMPPPANHSLFSSGRFWGKSA